MKMYIVKYCTTDIDINDKVFWSSLTPSNVYYIGADYDEAVRMYKKAIRYNHDNIKFLSFEFNSFDNCAEIGSVQTDAELIKIGTEYDRFVKGICEVRSSLAKNGKLTIVLNKDYFDSRGKRAASTNSHAWTEFDIDETVKLRVLRDITNQWVEDNHITVPFKVNCEGKTICQYNQK